MDTAWSCCEELKLEELKAAVESYRPLRKLNIPRVNILLVGAVGAGKSSYFNTINSIFRGRVTSQANSGSSEHSLTTQFRKYKVRSSRRDRPLRFRLCDTRGLEESQGLDAVDAAAILDGHLPDRHMFNPAESISSTVPTDSTPPLHEKIHCIAIVLDACAVDVFPEKILANIRAIQQKANQRGIPQVAILTKIDKTSSEVSQDPSLIFTSSTVKEVVEKAAELVGLPRAHVLPVKNYEREKKLNDQVDTLALSSLRQMLLFADDYLYNYLDDEEDKLAEWMDQYTRPVMTVLAIIAVAIVAMILKLYFR